RATAAPLAPDRPRPDAARMTPPVAEWLAAGQGVANGAAWSGMPGSLAMAQAPGNGLSGLPLLVQPILNTLDLGGILNTDFVGTVTATVLAGPGTITAGATALVVLGIAVFVGLTITGSGATTLQFSAPGLRPVIAVVNIT